MDKQPIEVVWCGCHSITCRSEDLLAARAGASSPPAQADSEDSDLSALDKSPSPPEVFVPPAASDSPMSQSESDAESLPSTDEELRTELAAFLKSKIRAAKGKGKADDTFEPNKKVKQKVTAISMYYAMLAIVYDPTAVFPGNNLRAFEKFLALHNDPDKLFAFELICKTYWSHIEDIVGFWGKTDDAGESSKGPGRTEKDIKAQKDIKAAYGGACPLTGSRLCLEGAHILDVKVTNNFTDDEDALNIWNLLRIFWPLGRLRTLKVTGQENRNVLPLVMHAHKLWDSHKIALRPVEHPDPSRMFIQLVILGDIYKEGALLKGSWDPCQGALIDYRRGVLINGLKHLPEAQHGSAFELISAKDGYELPSFPLLQLRFAAQKRLAAMRASGALRDIFSGPPPKDTSIPVPSEEPIPAVCELSINAAVEEGIIDEQTAELWTRCVLRDMYAEREDWRKTLDSIGSEEAKELDLGG
ncbi:hypothetical protein QBC34DRAFT_465048 [Podospora aff. communis PSN243]|uniref:HNH nuclease domain-containing protein n=1 Tax=Podospora aff. communis PSN243 TaxID=3040156 RepID=A0AAV9H3C1_9PEZI|nr:hypothetical protein QBC34DRAFT_465048 [Podospora aff. communis PSN243]